MNKDLTGLCGLLAENRDVMKKALKWEASLLQLAGAALFTAQGRLANEEQIEQCKALLKESTGAFSALRGFAKVPLLCRMAASGYPEAYLAGVTELYERLKKEKEFRWVDGTYLAMTAMTLFGSGGLACADENTDRLLGMYRSMKKEHKWLTSSEDVPFAALMAASGRDVQEMIDESETCYSLLRTAFRDGNARQTLSHVLALTPPAAEEKCERTAELWRILKERKHRFGTGTAIAMLGLAAAADVPVETMAEDIIRADDILKDMKGFGASIGTEQRRMYAALLALCRNAVDVEDGAAVTASVAAQTAVEVEMEICMLILCSTTTNTVVTTSAAAHT